MLASWLDPATCTLPLCLHQTMAEEINDSCTLEKSTLERPGASDQYSSPPVFTEAFILGTFNTGRKE